LLAVALVLTGLDLARAVGPDYDTIATTTTPLGQRSAAHTIAVSPYTKVLRRYIESRSGDVTVAIDDLRTGRTYLWNPRERAQTASIVKVDILETLLHRAMVSHTALGAQTADTVQGMIEESDNEDATHLWNEVSGASGIFSYNQIVGMSQTDPNTEGYWGETTTSAADQIRLLKRLVERGLLDAAARRYELGLMENVIHAQDWGVSAGIPAGVSVALKNGWVPLSSDTDWEVNSIGRIKGDGRWYLIAVLTDHDPSEQYGIDTIEGISSLVWRALETPVGA
jgi:beta-lactamase class A